MTYSYTQIGHYLACPRRYKHRYLDGWKGSRQADTSNSIAGTHQRRVSFKKNRCTECQ